MNSALAEVSRTSVFPSPVAAPLEVAIVDDSPLFRECLATVLGEDDSILVSATVASRRELMERPPSYPPDVFLVAISLPHSGALELTRWIGSHYPGSNVLVLGLEEATEPQILECIDAGASGYLSRRSSLSDLRQCLEALMRGETLCSPRLAHSVFSRLAQLAHEPEPASAQKAEQVLTSRELEILELVAEGLANKEIAQRLIISLHTVKNHVHNILEKLEVSGRYAAVSYAYERRWLRERWR